MTIRGQEQARKAMHTAVKAGMAVLMIGETGTGKTSLVRELAKEHKKEFSRVNLNGQTGVDEFVGRWLLKNGETIWQDGILTQAMRAGKWLVVDEINAALPEILFVLQSVLDGESLTEGYLVLAEKDGEVVHPHEDFRLFATMNPPGEYSGTKDLNKAQLSRYGTVIEIGYVSPEIEREILIERVQISEADATIMADYANNVRKLKAASQVFFAISTRDLLAWAKISKASDNIYDGFVYAVLNKIQHDDEKKQLRLLFETTNEDYKGLYKKYKVDSYKSLMEKLTDKIKKAEAIEGIIAAKKQELEETGARIKEDTKKQIDKALKGK